MRPTHPRWGNHYTMVDGVAVPIISGGDGTDTPDLPDVPEGDALAAADEADLRTLHESLTGMYDERRPNAASLADLAVVQRIQAGREAIATELTRRQTEAEELQSALAGLDAAQVALPETPPAGETVPEAAAAPATVPAQPVAEPVAAAPVVVSASALAAETTPQTAGQLAPTTRVRVPMRAAASQNYLPPGSEVDADGLAEMFSRELHEPPADGMVGRHRTVLASIRGAEEDPAVAAALGSQGGILTLRNGVVATDAMIDQAITEHRNARPLFGQPVPITAAICGPLDIVREIPRCSDTSETFSPQFPSRPAGRLGYQFTPPVGLRGDVDPDGEAGDFTLELADGTARGDAEWLQADQDAIDDADPTTWKPCVRVICPTPVSVTMAEIVACFTVDESTELSAPEKVREIQEKLSARLARRKVGMLLRLLAAGSIDYADTTPISGSLVDAASAVMRVLERAEYDDRLTPGGYTVAYGPGFEQSLVLDLLSRGFGQLAEARLPAALDTFQSATGARNLMRLQDVEDGAAHPFGGILPTVAAGLTPLPEMPTSFRLYLYDTSSWLYSSTGAQDTGLQTSPELARRNRKQWFSREWLSLAHIGCAPSFTVDVELCPSGSRAQLIAGADCGFDSLGAEASP